MKRGIVFSLIVGCVLSFGMGLLATPNTAQASPFQSAQLQVQIGSPIHIHHHRRHRRHVVVIQRHEEHHDNGHHYGERNEHHEEHHDKH